jgi:surface carbohydrate biosynthesis protein (TIGR04326 family)
VTICSPIVVWDQRGEPPPGPHEVLCWQSYREGQSVASVPRYLETHAQRIRGKYLAFIHDLGEYHIRGKRVIDHFDLERGFSLWWMTLLAEKSPLKSPRIYDCLRMIALEEMLADKSPSELFLVSADKPLALAMQRLCRNLNRSFHWQLPASDKLKWSARRIYHWLPQSLQGLLSLRQVIARWSLRGARIPRWFSGADAIFICSYFIHLAPNCESGQFYSRQWEVLPDSLHDSGRRMNWLQLFLFSAAVPNAATGLRWIRRFNADPGTQGHHAFLDSYLTVGLLWRVLTNWLRLHVLSWRLREIQSGCNLEGSAVWLWPLVRADWHASLTGPVAVSNCLWVALFDAALGGMPIQRTGLYLCENQNWEKAFLHAWRKYGHGQIIGVQHATAPYWHLYYLDDPRSLQPGRRSGLPMPDLIAINGAAARRTFIEAGYPAERLFEVEALRYLNLAKPAVASRHVSDGTSRIKVLVLGDMIAGSMRHLLGLLEQAMQRLHDGFSLTFKPHPAYAVDLAAFPGLKADRTTEALSEILGDYDVAVVANSTSAAVDAYLSGLPVIIALDGDELNLSPLRGEAEVCFVSTCEELTEALRAARRGAAPANPGANDFFHLDPALPRWKRLLRTGSPDRADSKMFSVSSHAS